MSAESRPLGPYDPTDDDLTRARRRLAEADRADILITAFTQIAGRIEGIGQPHTDVDQSIREMRAALAAYDERRRAVES